MAAPWEANDPSLQDVSEYFTHALVMPENKRRRGNDTLQEWASVDSTKSCVAIMTEPCPSVQALTQTTPTPDMDIPKSSSPTPHI